MRRDLIIGVLLSVLVHGGIAISGELAKGGPKKKVVDQEEDAVVVNFTPPPIEPEEVDAEDLESSEEVASSEPSFAPPTLVDVPGTVEMDSFTQTLQPPPPPSANISATMSIPKGNPTGSPTGKGLKDVFNVRDLDQQLQPKPGQAKPVYPYELKRSGIQGSVAVEYIVDANGNVIDAFVLRSSQREFEQPALQAIMKWKFRPGKKGGKPVKVRVQQLIQFSITDDE